MAVDYSKQAKCPDCRRMQEAKMNSKAAAVHVVVQSVLELRGAKFGPKPKRQCLYCGYAVCDKCLACGRCEFTTFLDLTKD